MVSTATESVTIAGLLEHIHEVHETFRPFFNELKQLELESECWARAEMEAPECGAIDDARSLLSRLQANALVPAGLIASADGGVGIFFRKQDRYADLEVLNNGVCTAVVSDGKGRVKAFSVDLSFEGLTTAIQTIREFLQS
jgi:hypothetical protein